MCEEFEWLAWQYEAAQRAEKEKADKLKKQEQSTTPAKSARPEQHQEEPVPA